MIFIIVCLTLSVCLAVILISEFWYIKQKKDSDKAYLEDLRIQRSNHYPLEINKGK